ncbi:M24 family metallopeptidase [Aminobacter sp. MSH1]|uniref:M24 family metallopeptidase n=1 Tax=Aminobacter sp. MSH1 TaxID=374606 RepID=UPI00131F4207|nr:M24 family metallopeptidase [Aminobacter sp. MSH1]
MTVVEMGAFDTARDLSEDDASASGIERIRGTPSFVSVGYTNHYEADIVVEELKRIGARSIGLLCPSALPNGLVAALKDSFPEALITDVTDLVDTIKAIKSDEEIALIRRVANLQDRVFAEVCDFIRPGLTDIDVANHAQSIAHRLGSDQGIILGVSAPIGLPARFLGRHFQSRTIEAGDHMSLLIEVNGPGGLYSEIARTMVLGSADDALIQAFENVRAAQAHTLSLLKPGMPAADVARSHDAWMVKHGLPAERRLYAHGQGVDMVERPLIRRDESMLLDAGMCLAVHPGYDDGQVFAVICDNYLIVHDGVSECLHRTEKKIFEIGS